MATDARDLSRAVPPTADGGPRGRSPLLWARLRQLIPAATSELPAVLDCGGGSGSLSVPLAALGARVTVVDVSIDALSTFLRRAAEAGVSDRVAAVQGDVESLAELVTPGGFDVVLAHEVLASVSQPAAVLRQIADALRPGGVASVLVANPVAVVLGRVLAGDVSGALSAFHRPAEVAYGLAAVLADCERAGLTVESVQGIGAFTELVPGIDLERPGAVTALAELESAAAELPPYRDIASRLHIVARRSGVSPG